MQKLDDEFLANGGSFENRRIGDIFTIGTGSLLEANELKTGNINRISVKSDNNGIIGIFDTRNSEKARHFENFISVNFFGGVFYHPYLASVEMKVHTLKIDGVEFSNSTGLYLASSLSKALNGMFGYGNQLSSTLLKSGNYELELPIRDNKIDYEYMERYIYILLSEKLRRLKNYIAENNLENLSLTDEEKTAIGGGRDWQAFRIGDLFNRIAQGARLTKQDQIKGDLPFVMSGITETGVVAKIGNSKNEFPSNSLTIDIFGNVFYRSFRFGASDDVGVYWNDDKQIDKLAMLFIGCSIQTALTGQFSYGHKLRSSKSSDLTCFLPVKNNEPDYEYMATFIKAIQKQVIKPVVEFTQKQLAEN